MEIKRPGNPGKSERKYGEGRGRIYRPAEDIGPRVEIRKTVKGNSL